MCCRPDGCKYSIFADMGSHHIFLARYISIHNPRQVMRPGPD